MQTHVEPLQTFHSLSAGWLTDTVVQRVITVTTHYTVCVQAVYLNTTCQLSNGQSVTLMKRLWLPQLEQTVLRISADEVLMWMMDYADHVFLVNLVDGNESTVIKYNV